MKPSATQSMRRPHAPVRAAAALSIAAGMWAAAPASLASQSLEDPIRLEGVDELAVRASAVWDEAITTSAGGATAAQFEEALLMGLTAAIEEAERGPTLDPGAAGTLVCHVDTFYDSGLVVYSVRASYQVPVEDRREVATWLTSWVGSYTAQQLHVIWTLADQCADVFLRAWATANPA